MNQLALRPQPMIYLVFLALLVIAIFLVPDVYAVEKTNTDTYFEEAKTQVESTKNYTKIIVIALIAVVIIGSIAGYALKLIQINYLFMLIIFILIAGATLYISKGFIDKM